MNKKLYFTIFAVIVFFAVGSILCHYLFPHKSLQITPEDAEKLCYSVLGEKDEQTGFPFSFGVTQTINKDGKEYYIIRASWLVNNSHMSYIGDFFVSTDGKEIYSGFSGPDNYTIENLIWRE